jgi:hypothetical protein
MVAGQTRWNNVPGSPLPKRRASPVLQNNTILPYNNAPVLHNYPPLPPIEECYSAFKIELHMPRIQAFLANLTPAGVLYLNFRLDMSKNRNFRYEDHVPAEVEDIDELDFSNTFRSSNEPFYFRVVRLFLDQF